MAAKMNIQKVYARGEHEGWTPYMISRIVNEALTARGLDEIPSQMMYNYDKNGLINGTKKQNEVRGYTTAEAEAFRDRFVEMRAKKAQANPVTAEAIQAQIEALQAKLAELQSQDLEDQAAE